MKKAPWPLSTSDDTQSSGGGVILKCGKKHRNPLFNFCYFYATIVHNIFLSFTFKNIENHFAVPELICQKDSGFVISSVIVLGLAIVVGWWIEKASCLRRFLDYFCKNVKCT